MKKYLVIALSALAMVFTASCSSSFDDDLDALSKNGSALSFCDEDDCSPYYGDCYVKGIDYEIRDTYNSSSKSNGISVVLYDGGWNESGIGEIGAYECKCRVYINSREGDYAEVPFSEVMYGGSAYKVTIDNNGVFGNDGKYIHTIIVDIVDADGVLINTASKRVTYTQTDIIDYSALMGTWVCTGEYELTTDAFGHITLTDMETPDDVLQDFRNDGYYYSDITFAENIRKSAAGGVGCDLTINNRRASWQYYFNFVWHSAGEYWSLSLRAQEFIVKKENDKYVLYYGVNGSDGALWLRFENNAIIGEPTDGQIGTVETDDDPTTGINQIRI